MGVHTTFVRSVDLDEWTQRQIDAMRLGGNGNAKTFFRQHGLSEMHGKIEQKYQSRAAVAYKIELAKQVEAEACKRGEGSGAAASVATAGSLLENLELQHSQDMNAEARAKLAAAKGAAAATNGSVAQPKMQLASLNKSAKGKLVVTPPTSGGLTAIRKPGTLSSSGFLKKKPVGGAKLRVNKLSQQANGSDTQNSDDAFAEADTAAAVKAEEEAAKKAAEAAARAKAAAAMAKSVPVPEPVASPKSPEKRSTMEDGVSRLKMMNNDFFSGV